MTPFDNDGEGFCNPRLAGGAADIGFDEQDAYIVFGYTPQTTRVGPLAAGNQYGVSFFLTPPAPSTTGLLYATASLPVPLYLPTSPPALAPEVRALGTSPPTTIPPLVGPVCLGGALYPGFPVPIAVPPAVGAVTTATITAGGPFANTLLNEQFVFFSSPLTVSNLQTFTAP